MNPWGGKKPNQTKHTKKENQKTKKKKKKKKTQKTKKQKKQKQNKTNKKNHPQKSLNLKLEIILRIKVKFDKMHSIQAPKNCDLT